jgi:hypothetical protein
VTDLNFSELQRKYTYDGSHFRENTGKPGKKAIISEDIIILELCKLGLSYSEARDFIPLAQEKLTTKSKSSMPITTQSLIDKVKASNLFKDFYLVNPSLDSPWLLYRKQNGYLRLIDSVESLKAEDFFAYIKGSDVKLGRELQELLSDHVKSDKNLNPSIEECLRFLLKETMFPELIDNVLPHTTPIFPASVEGSGVVAFYEIPYKEENVTIDNLNGHLKELLFRIDNHKHLCAIIWGSLTGKAYPYIVYLVGTGGDGKTSFINMLIKLVNGSAANFQSGSDFSGGNMYGKAIIQVAENNNPYLLHDSQLKNITGGGLVNINRKNRDAFSAHFKTLVIADSNIHLEVDGDPSEQRRLRYHEVLPPNLIDGETISPDEYVALLSSTPNEFLNYCRVCFEELKTQFGLIELPKNNKEVLAKLYNSGNGSKFKKFLNSFPEHEFGVDNSCNRNEIIDELEKKYPTIKNIRVLFEKYLRNKHQVKIIGEKYIGWGDQVTESTQPTEKIGLPE